MKNLKVVLSDGNIRYKIANNFKFNPSTRKRYPEGSCVFAIDKGSKLSFRKIKYQLGSKLPLKPSMYLIFSVRNNKLIVYLKKRTAPDTFSLKTLVSLSDITWAFQDIFGCKRGIIKKAHLNRVKSIFKQWAKKNKLNYKKTDTLIGLISSVMYPSLDPKFCLNVSGVYSRYLREPDFKDSIKKCFGNNGKVITSLVCQSLEKTKSCDVFRVGAALKGFLSTDAIQSILKAYLEGCKNAEKEAIKADSDFLSESYIFNGPLKAISNKQDLTVFKRLLSQYKEERIIKLLKSPSDHTSDTLRMWRQLSYNKTILPDKPKSFNEIHDTFSIQIAKLNSPDCRFNIKDSDKVIDGAKVGDFTIEIPKSYYQLIDYGSKMSNCIASYNDRMRLGLCLLIGVYRDGELIYNIMIENKSIPQFYGIGNSIPLSRYRDLIEEFLKQKDLINYTSLDVPF